MAFKLLITLAILALATAGLLPAQPQVHYQAQTHHQPATIVHHEAQHPHQQQHQTQHLVQLQSHSASPQPNPHSVAHLTHAAQLSHATHAGHSAHEIYPNDPHPQYNFAYDVQDAVSGDSKSHTESRDGDVVHGEYSLNDADGFRRTVKYTSDPHNGFNAVVSREPLAHQKLVLASPAVHYAHPQPHHGDQHQHQQHQQQHHQHQQNAHATVSYAAPAASYTAPLSAHHEHEQQHQASSYTTYEVPQRAETHEFFHHQH